MNGTAVVPLEIAPWRRAMPFARLAAGGRVPDAEPTHPLIKRKPRLKLLLMTKDTPSSEVKHCASEKAPSACTLTTPCGVMRSRPFFAAHRLVGTHTSLDGRKPTGSVNATGLVPVVAIAPRRCTALLT